MSKKHKARFIFEDNGLSIVKGYVQKNDFDEKPKIFLYGANNLINLERNKKQYLISDGVTSVNRLKELAPGLKMCIVDKECLYDFDSSIVKKSSFEKSNNSIHISIEEWLLDIVKDVLNQKNESYRNKINNKNEDKFGLIQPSLSSVISELILEGLNKSTEEK